MKTRCVLRGGSVRIRPERDLLWDCIFAAHYLALPEKKAGALEFALKAYERPQWRMPRLRAWAGLRRMQHV
jgi:hypothetical protein